MKRQVVKVKFENQISKPVNAVFRAIVEPERMSQYFISRASGPIAEGKTITWFFDDVGGVLDVVIKEVEANKRVVFDWPASGVTAQVEIVLEATDRNTTKVTITESGWPMDSEGVGRALEQAMGWTDFFCCMKAFLLFGVDLRRGTKANVAV